MDSLTQATLGAAVGVAVMRQRVPVWQSVLWGAAMGTLPDLDVLFDFGDPISNMTEHRGPSHALFVQGMAAMGLVAMVKGWRWVRGVTPTQGSGQSQDLTLRWGVATLLVWVTHALLDAMTVYGTRLWLPFSSQAVGVGSVFIIDPLYTLPLLAGLLGMWALRGKAAQRSLWLGLTISSLYLVWSVLAQQWVKHQVQPHLPNPQVKVLVTPSAFNTLLWRVVAVDNQAYHETWVSLLDDEQPPQWQRVTCPVAAFEPYQQVRVVAQLANFSDGFFCFRASGKRWQITDLRMGQEPNYVFTFQGEPVGGDAGNGWRVTQLPVAAPPIGDALRWLGQRTLGHTQLPFEQWQAAGKTRP